MEGLSRNIAVLLLALVIPLVAENTAANYNDAHNIKSVADSWVPLVMVLAGVVVGAASINALRVPKWASSTLYVLYAMGAFYALCLVPFVNAVGC
jgi:hypothetical protein